MRNPTAVRLYMACLGAAAGLVGGCERPKPPEVQRQIDMWRNWVRVVEDPSHQFYTFAPQRVSEPREFPLVQDRTAATEPLLRVLRVARGQHRVAVIRALSLVGSGRKRVGDAVLGATRFEDPQARAAAAEALAELRWYPARERLKELLGDDNYRVRAAAARAIAAVGGDGETGDRLVRMLEAGVIDEKIAAATALGTVAPWQADRVAALIRASAAGNPALRAAAVESLGKLRDARGIDAVVAALDDGEPAVQEAAVAACASLGANVVGTPAEQTVTALVSRLRTSPPTTATAHVRALAGIPSGAAQKAIAKCLHDPDGDLRLAAALAAGVRLRPPPGGSHDETSEAIVEALSRVLEDDRPDVRAAAAGALGSQTAHSAIGALAAALRRDEEAHVREVAAASLGECLRAMGSARMMLAGPVMPPQPADGRVVAAFEPLEAATRDPATAVRLAALRALEAGGQIRSELLRQCLADDELDIRLEVVWILGRLRVVDQEGGKLLREALTGGAAPVRLEAAWVVGDLGWLEVLADEAGNTAQDVEVRRACVLGIARHLKQVRDALGEFLRVKVALERLWSDPSTPAPVRQAVGECLWLTVPHRAT